MEPHHTNLPSWAYPAEDDVPESLLHLTLRTLLWQLVRRHLAAQGAGALVGSEQFIYWERDNTYRCVAPDLYVLLGWQGEADVRVIRTWEEGVPDLAIEIVSDDHHKDYVTGPSRYARIGVRELIVIDPTTGPERHRFQVYRRAGSGDLIRVVATDASRTSSEVLGCDLVWQDVGPEGGPRVRLAIDGDWVLTEAEHERAQKEAERAQKEAAWARARELEAENERLRAQLRRTDD